MILLWAGKSFEGSLPLPWFIPHLCPLPLLKVIVANLWLPWNGLWMQKPQHNIPEICGNELEFRSFNTKFFCALWWPLLDMSQDWRKNEKYQCSLYWGPYKLRVLRAGSNGRWFKEKSSPGTGMDFVNFMYCQQLILLGCFFKIPLRTF